MSDPMANGVPPAGVDVEKRTAQYIALRDKIAELTKEFEAKLEPYKQIKGALEAELMRALESANVSNMAVRGVGTVFYTDKATCTVEDMDAFRAYVTNMGEWDIVDIKANAPAVAAYLAENNVLPPGVKRSVFRTLSVRRASGA